MTDPSAGRQNLLFYGDNLDVLREHIDTESVDLVYLDPPFNSNRSYNVLFKSKSGDESQAQIEAFDDTWTWSQQSEATYRELVEGGATLKVADALEAMRRLLGDNDVLAYLVMMAARLVELHRVLKPTGSLYLHCDPTASHYLKLLLDAVFGPTNFRAEVRGRRPAASSPGRHDQDGQQRCARRSWPACARRECGAGRASEWAGVGVAHGSAKRLAPGVEVGGSTSQGGEHEVALNPARTESHATLEEHLAVTSERYHGG